MVVLEGILLLLLSNTIHTKANVIYIHIIFSRLDIMSILQTVMNHGIKIIK